ncbi:MAG: hypothetical protein R3B57_09115 [Phycisphaerales bacterium]
MKLVHAARLSIAFLIVVFTLSLSIAVLSGGGGYSGRSPKPPNDDPRTVLVQFALLAVNTPGSSPSAIELLRERFSTEDDAKPADDDAFLKTLDEARRRLGAGDLWLSPALAAQHGEKAQLTVASSGETAEKLSIAALPSVMDKGVIRAQLDLDLESAHLGARVMWSTAITLVDRGVIAVDLASADAMTKEPRAMLLVVRASIITDEPD